MGFVYKYVSIPFSSYFPPSSSLERFSTSDISVVLAHRRSMLARENIIFKFSYEHRPISGVWNMQGDGRC